MKQLAEGVHSVGSDQMQIREHPGGVWTHWVDEEASKQMDQLENASTDPT